MRSLAVLAAAALAAAAAASSSLAADDPYAALLAPPGTCGAAENQLALSHAVAEQTMLCFTNYARAESGLVPLQLNATLTEAGDAKLTKDVSCGEFSHTPCSQPFTTVFADYLKGATSYRVGENILWGTGSYGTPREAMNAWLHSTGHREDILTPSFRELGIGYLAAQTFQGRSGVTLWSQEFGVRTPTAASSTQAPTPTAKPVATKPKPAPRLKKPKRHGSLAKHTGIRHRHIPR